MKTSLRIFSALAALSLLTQCDTPTGTGAAWGAGVGALGGLAYNAFSGSNGGGGQGGGQYCNYQRPPQGCQQQQPQYGSCQAGGQQPRKSKLVKHMATGAVLGAVGGAVVGNRVGNRYGYQQQGYQQPPPQGYYYR